MSSSASRLAGNALVFGSLAVFLLGCGNITSEPDPSWIQLEWKDRNSQPVASSVELTRSSGGFGTTEPIRIQAPIKGSVFVRTSLSQTQLPSTNFSDLSCGFRVVDEDRELWTSIIEPFWSKSLEGKPGGPSWIKFRIFQLEDSINVIHPGRKFLMNISVKDLKIQVPIWIE